MLPLAGRKRAASPNSAIVASSSRRPRSQTTDRELSDARGTVDADECKTAATAAMSTEDVGTCKETNPPGVNNSETTSVDVEECKTDPGTAAMSTEDVGTCKETNPSGVNNSETTSVDVEECKTDPATATMSTEDVGTCKETNPSGVNNSETTSVDVEECKTDPATATMSTEDVGTSKEPGVYNKSGTSALDESIEVKHPLRGKIHAAIKAGNLDLLRSMLKKGENVCWHGNINCITLAVKQGDVTLLEELLEAEPQAVNLFTDSKYQHVLSYCKNNPAMFWYVLKQMKDPLIFPIDDLCKFICTSTTENQIKALDHLNSINYVFNFKTVVKNFRDYPEIINLLFEKKYISVEKIINLNANTLLQYCNQIKYLEVAKCFVENLFVDSNIKISLPNIVKYIDEFSTSLPPMIKLYIETGLINSNLSPEELKNLTVHFEDPLKLPVLKLLSDCHLICLQDRHILNICAHMLAHESCHTELARKVIEHFQDLNLPLEDGDGKSLVHHTTDPEVQLYLLQELQANFNIELQQEFLCKLVNNHLQFQNINKCLDIVLERGIEITGGENKSLFSLTGHIKVIEKLISFGCTDTMPPDILLGVSHSLFELPLEEMKSMVNLLVAAGADLTATDVNQCSLFCHALKSSKSCSKGKLSVLRYILKRPEFQDGNFSFPCGVTRMCNHLPCDELLPCLFKNQNFKKIPCDNIYSVFEEEMQLTFIKKPYKIGLSATIIDFELKKLIPDYYLQELISKITWGPQRYPTYTPKCCERVKQLLSAGLDLKQENGVSSLTVWLLYNQKRYEPQIIKSLVSRGVNVESSVLELKDENLRNLQQKLRVPDAFLLSTIRDADAAELKFVQDYCKHLACAPTCLFLYMGQVSNRSKYQSYKSLVRKSPRVPHGTSVYRSIRDKLKEIDLVVRFQVGYKRKLADIFDHIHRQPLTLLELSRYVVRMSLADQAARSLTQSLPQMFDSLLPPGLNGYLISKKIYEFRLAERLAEITVT